MIELNERAYELLKGQMVNGTFEN